jgi:hypothetical protein
MAISHFTALLLFSFLVSVVFVKIFGAFVGIALALGWIMYPLP